MTITTTTGTGAAYSATASTGTHSRTGRIRLTNVVRSEWIKFWSVRSTAVTLLAAGLATIALGMIFSAVAESEDVEGPAALLSDPVDIALGGIGLTEMIIGVLGVIFVAGEYSTGLIRTAFASVGRRSRVIAAKAVVIAAGVFAVGLVAVTGAVAAGQAVYAGAEATVAVNEVWEVVLGTTLYLTGIALIGVALGFSLRSTAGGIGTLFGTVFIGPNLLTLLPESITDVFMKYLPSEAGSAMMSRVSNPDLLSRGAGYAVFAAWVAGLLVLAGVLVSRRDA
ncbi:MAG: ABC transporter permease [Actinomycetota bacterium]